MATEGPPRVVPGYLGVGWEREDERTLPKGASCRRCGRVAGRTHVAPRGVFCLACLGFHPDDERRALRFGYKMPSGARPHRAAAPRLTREDRRVLASNVHGAVFLAALDAERRGDGDAASRYRLWSTLYRDGDLSEAELSRLAEEDGAWRPSRSAAKCARCGRAHGESARECEACGGPVLTARERAERASRKGGAA